MNPAYLNPRFFRHFDPARWEDELCAELVPALRLFLAEPGQAIASMGLENVKMPDLTVLLRHPPSPEAFADLQVLSARDASLSVQPGWIGCLKHCSTIEWESAPPAPDPPTPKLSLFKRLFG